jgi:hypothetical protein
MSITKTKVCNQQKAAFSDDFKRLYIKPMTINYSYRSDFIGLLSAILAALLPTVNQAMSKEIKPTPRQIGISHQDSRR